MDYAQDRFPGWPVRDVEQRSLLSGCRQPRRRRYAGDAKQVDYALEKGAIVRHQFSDAPMQEYRSAGSISRLLSSVKAEVGMITPPHSDEMKTAPGEKLVEGKLQVLVRDLAVRADGFLSEENPLAAPIYLFPDKSRAWMVGPGDLQLARLQMEVPYRAQLKWFVTPDQRLEAVGQLIEVATTGTLDGELRYHYPGHLGYPAFRGVARMSGTTGAVFPGSQVAEWKHVRWDPDTGVVHSWWWEGVTKLDARWKMDATIAFDEVEVFN